MAVPVSYYSGILLLILWDRRGRDRMVVDLLLPMQSVPISASSNPAHGEV